MICLSSTQTLDEALTLLAQPNQARLRRHTLSLQASTDPVEPWIAILQPGHH
jgi:hypothetical protein